MDTRARGRGVPLSRPTRPPIGSRCDSIAETARARLARSLFLLRASLRLLDDFGGLALCFCLALAEKLVPTLFGGDEKRFRLSRGLVDGRRRCELLPRLLS